MLEILSEQIISEQGSFKRVKRWVRGRHPHLGSLLWGLSGGWETVIEMDVITPMGFFKVDNCDDLADR